MNDGDDLDHQDLVDDVVNHPVFTASGRVERKQGCFQLFAEPPEICGQRLMDEFKRRSGNFLGEGVAQRPSSGSGETDFVVIKPGTLGGGPTGPLRYAPLRHCRCLRL